MWNALFKHLFGAKIKGCEESNFFLHLPFLQGRWLKKFSSFKHLTHFNKLRVETAITKTEFQLRVFLRKFCNCPLVQLVSVKLLEASAECERTRKDHSKSKDFTVRRLKLLVASHNISFVLLIDKEFESMSCC